MLRRLNRTHLEAFKTKAAASANMAHGWFFLQHPRERARLATFLNFRIHSMYGHDASIIWFTCHLLLVSHSFYLSNLIGLEMVRSTCHFQNTHLGAYTARGLTPTMDLLSDLIDDTMQHHL